MRKSLLALLICLLLTGLVLAQDETLAPAEIPGQAVYVPFPVAIDVDGDLSEWANVPAVTVDRALYGGEIPGENSSFTFGLAADAETLYIYMTMPDANIIAGEHGENYWFEDSLEFYLNLTDNRWITFYEDGISQARVSPVDINNTDPDALTITGEGSDGAPVSGFVFPTEEGWGFEVAVDISEYLEPAHGTEFGFQAHANGASEEDRDTKLIWGERDAADVSWRDPSAFGSAIFFEVGSDNIPEPSEGPNPEVFQILDIAINQLGYAPDAPKTGVMAVAEDTESATWELHTLAGTTVLSGEALIVDDAASGDRVAVADFSEIEEPGTYTLSIQGQESYAFEIGEGLYETLPVDAARYFYLHRSGIPLSADYAGDWAREAGHLSDNSVTCIEGCDFIIDASGGWYDGGEYGKYVVGGGFSVWTLHNLFERFPEAFADGSLNIPESGNNVPDILDEARWHMEWMLKMQVPEGETFEGMAFAKLHDRIWADLPSMPPTEFDNDNERTNEMAGRYLMEITTAATLNLAATGAQCARVWADFDPDFAAQCLSAAETAWTAAIQNPDLLAQGVPGQGGSNFRDDRIADEFYWAATELFITTGDDIYGDFMRDSSFFTETDSASTNPTAGLDWQNTAMLGTLALVASDADLVVGEIVSLEDQITDLADSYLEIIAEQAYALPLEVAGYVEGSNANVLNNAIIMAVAHDITGKQKYMDGIVQSMNYILGHNPREFSYVSGYGNHALTFPHHRFWANETQNGFPPPAPGAVAGGAVAEPREDVTRFAAAEGSGPAKFYTDNRAAFSSNEVTNQWNAALTWVATYLNAMQGE